MRASTSCAKEHWTKRRHETCLTASSRLLFANAVFVSRVCLGYGCLPPVIKTGFDIIAHLTCALRMPRRDGRLFGIEHALRNGHRISCYVLELSFGTDSPFPIDYSQEMTNSRTLIRAATPADAEAIASVHVVSWREAYEDLLPKKMLSALDVAERSKRWRSILSSKSEKSEMPVFIAMREEKTIGFVSAGPQRQKDLNRQGFAGEIEALYVLKARQRSGVGRELLHVAAENLLQAGISSAALWVLEDNYPARGFYEAMGARPITTRKDVRGDVVLSELAYGWVDLVMLARNAEKPSSH